MGIMRRQMRRRAVVGTAMTVSMVSGARKNRAERKAIEGATDQQQQQDQPQQTTAPAADPTVELAKYKKLLDDGTITQEDYDAKKKELLGL